MCRGIDFEIVEEVIHDLAVIEADLGELPAVDLDDFMDVPYASGVLVVRCIVSGIVRLGPWNRLHAAQRRLVAVHDKTGSTADIESLMFIEYRGKKPSVDPSAFVAPTAVLIGDVHVGPESSIWFGAILRGDNGAIRIGARTSVQDNCVIHVGDRGLTAIGDDVTIGHCAVMEDCDIKNHALIGSNAVLLNGSVIGEGTLIAAGSVVGQDAEIPARVVAAGAPAQVKKKLEGEAAKWIELAADEYVALSRSYLEQNIGNPAYQETLN
jgi:carbonic anhydrase/acetyltransferase-like protein (isoleucine patch superfamily)